MYWIDAGVNLLDKRFSLADMFSRSLVANVTKILAISSDIEQSHQTLSFLKSYPTNDAFFPANKSLKIRMTAGVHPHYANNCDNQTWAKLQSIIADNSVVAIGECGLDFNRNFSSPKSQLYAFEKQLEMAARFNMGVYLHEREAFEPQIKLLEQYAGSLKFMVTHCFTGTNEQLSTYIDLGCYVGITGWLCDQKRGGDLREAVKHLPLKRLLLETDSPYLFPKTLKPRKSTNEACNIPFIAEALADITDYTLNEINLNSTNNGNQLFFNEQGGQ